MKTKIRTMFLTALFFLGLLTASAQDKYEYAVIDYTPRSRFMAISISGTEYKEITIDKNAVKGDNDVNPALLEVNNMIKEGWELFNTTTVAMDWTKGHIFYFKRKVS